MGAWIAGLVFLLVRVAGFIAIIWFAVHEIRREAKRRKGSV